MGRDYDTTISVLNFHVELVKSRVYNTENGCPLGPKDSLMDTMDRQG